jgi:hypothetical protein
MIHIDIRRDSEDVKACVEYPKLLVRTSTDGAGWATQYVIYADAEVIHPRGGGKSTVVARGDVLQDQKLRAEDTARIFRNGCRYAGAETRLTILGYAA